MPAMATPNVIGDHPVQRANSTAIVSTEEDAAQDRSPQTPRRREPTDVPDEALLHGGSFFIVVACIIMAVLMGSLNTSILATVVTLYLQVFLGVNAHTGYSFYHF